MNTKVNKNEHERKEKKINSKTSAIMVVHLYGNPSNIMTIKKLIKGKSIKIV